MMKRMKKSLWMLVLGIGVLVAGQAVRAETIKMVWVMLPPHFYLDENTGEPRGAGIAYFEAVAARMGHTVEWVGPVPFPRQAKVLETAADGVAGALLIPKFPMFEGYVHFTAEPFYQMQPILVVRQDNPLTAIHSIDDIAGYRIGYAASTDSYYTPFLEAHRNQLHFEELFGDDWVVRNLRILVETDRLDAVFDRNRYTLPLPDPPEPMYVVFCKAAPQGERLVEAYNAAVKSMDFSYDDFLAKEF